MKKSVFRAYLMSGYGGITAVMMPNGVTYYYFSDKEEFSWYNAVHEANKQKNRSVAHSVQEKECSIHQG